MQLRASVALIDIEGTVGSIAFVRDVLFPYARERMDAYVLQHREEPDIRALLDEAAREAGVDVHDLRSILQALHAWSDQDIKVTVLKELQGRIWVEGFESSGIRGHLYDDAIAALHRFHDAGVSLYVYSSGSIAAQKLLFGHSVAGDLLPLFRGFYDTTTGGKREPKSYVHIARDIRVEPASIVFFSDNVHELDAAAKAGIQTMQLARPEDGTTPSNAHPAIATFDGIEIAP
ncbi:MAG TPA: acireductone synthase [Candidatus Baltobacteraceae bacterium]|jgi:enolase-phosphatase E1|nr:acireductone synthase [Candidatus Baltobacteraceae bacterium]